MDPGERHGYHAVTFGRLVGELLRRVTRREIRDLVSEEPGIPDLSIGLSGEDAHRAAFVLPQKSPPMPAPPLAGPRSWRRYTAACERAARTRARRGPRP
ncbi:hypothetical protein GCM10018952_60740 [Streptosporangium vulgare]